MQDPTLTTTAYHLQEKLLKFYTLVVPFCLTRTVKKCRFCGKSENDVEFKKVAHVFPEAIGNKTLFSTYECDECNQYFGDTIENEYSNFFNLFHSIMQVEGKKGIIKCKFKIPCQIQTEKCRKYCVEIDVENGNPKINKCTEVGREYLDLSNSSLRISKPVGKCCPIAVYKAIVKMAISVMPLE